MVANSWKDLWLILSIFLGGRGGWQHLDESLDDSFHFLFLFGEEGGGEGVLTTGECCTKEEINFRSDYLFSLPNIAINAKGHS